MYKLDEEKVRKILIEEMQYSPFDVDLFLKDYPLLHENLADTVDQWLDNRKVIDVVVEGLSLKDVMRKRRSHFLLVIRDFNKLLDESIPAERRKKFRETLSRPAFYQ